MFELAVLGLLSESPMHGYELRKRLNSTLGSFRAFSFGSLYPTLRRLQAAGHIATEDPVTDIDAVPLSSKRSRVTYRITADGKDRLGELLRDTGPQSWSDDGFGVHLAFFSRTTSDARMRILEGRRRRVEERREGLRSAMTKAAERLDTYTAELHQLGLEASDREVRWLNELINQERLGPAAGQRATSPDPSTGSSPTRFPSGTTPPLSTPPPSSTPPSSTPPS